MPTLIRPKAKAKGMPTRISEYWHIRYHCPIRRRSHVISTMCKRRKNAERRLREFCDLLEMGKVRRENPFILQREAQRTEVLNEQQAIKDCIVAFEADLRAGRLRRRGRRRPIRAEHGNNVMNYIRRIVDGCEIKTVDQLTVEAVNIFLDRCQFEKIIKSAQTRKHAERAIKSFSRWCCTTQRLERDPLARLDVTYVDPERDIVHNRSELTIEQVNLLIAAASEGRTYAGLTGRQRAALYAFAASSGFRARECAAVRRCDFGEDFRFVTLSGQFTKNLKRATVPIPSAIRQALIDYTADLSPEEFLWPGGWTKDGENWVEAGWIKDRRAGEILREDATKVGIVIGRKGKEANAGKVVYDFHSLRHTYISNLERAGISEGMKKQLARATAGIVERDTHRELGQLSEVAERIPTPNVSALLH